MPYYVKLGKVPPKRHITFYKDDGVSLYREELFSTKGFSSIYSNKYHIHLPTEVEKIDEIKVFNDEMWDNAPIMYYHFMTDKKQTAGNFLSARQLFMKNANCRISTAHVTEDCDFFYKNSHMSELVFVHHGSGKLLSEYGVLEFKQWDYLIIPKGTIYQMKFDSYDKVKLFIVESTTPFDIPRHFRNEYGQLTEEAPYYERDFRPPSHLDPKDEAGEFRIVMNLAGRHFEYKVPHHPFDVVGWDGFLYPYAFNIADYAPKVGKLHLPPPVHLTFTTGNFVVCSFCPRLFDFHPEAVPAPYFHSNVDSDEVLYYVDGDFMSRSGIVEGSVTLHPMGIPHGPQPGRTEASIGKKETYEYAVMVDTFTPLYVTTNVKETLVAGYENSWITK